MKIEFSVVGYDFDSLLIEQGADELLEGLEEVLERERDYSNNWQRVMDMAGDMPGDVTEAVVQYEQMVIKRVIEKLKAVYLED